jgi:hypothetical protein
MLARPKSNSRKLLYFDRETPTYEDTVRVATQEAKPKRRLAAEALKAIGDLAGDLAPRPGPD